jgi:(2Fe-2S) ferredoxin
VSLDRVVKKRGIGSYQCHVLLCTGDKCAPSETGLKVWEELKSKLSARDPQGQIFRTKVGCLRICQQGPIAVVYPEGAWIKDVQVSDVDRLIDRCQGDKMALAEKTFAFNPLEATQ